VATEIGVGTEGLVRLGLAHNKTYLPVYFDTCAHIYTFANETSLNSISMAFRCTKCVG